MKVECALGGDLYLVEEKSVYKLVQSERFGTAVALAFAGGKFAPLSWEGISVLVFRVEQVALVEADAKTAFAVLIPAIGAAKAEADMVVGDTIIDDGGLPIIMGIAVVAGVVRVPLRKLIGGIEPGGALVYVRVSNDHGVNGEGL